MWVLVNDFRHEMEVKKSRFICLGRRIHSPAEAIAFLEEVRQPDAAHNCFAYRIGSLCRSSDDGEPGGTAGRPMLRAIDGQQVDQVMVVVVRYFGGIKLGAGGLVRAYAGVTAEGLRRAAKEERVVTMPLSVQVGFEAMGVVHGLLDRFDAKKEAERFDANGVRFEIVIPVDRAGEFRSAVVNGTGGAVCFDEPVSVRD